MAVTTTHAAMQGCLGFSLQYSFLFFTKYSLFVSTLFFLCLLLMKYKKVCFVFMTSCLGFLPFFTLTFDWDTTKLHFLTKKKRKKTMTMEPFGWNYKPAEKHCWLIFCERKILFRLKKLVE
jgi:hypothetical protein